MEREERFVELLLQLSLLARIRITRSIQNRRGGSKSAPEPIAPDLLFPVQLSSSHWHI